MGCGKTTLGRKLAKKLHYQFIDIDQEIESTYKIPISSIFEKYDESGFRQLEHKVLKETAALKQVVISTGGGAPCFFDNMEFILQHGLVIYINLPSKTIYQRLSSAKKERPLLKNMNEKERYDFIQKQLTKREVYYNQAHITIKGIDVKADRIVEQIKPFLP